MKEDDVLRQTVTHICYFILVVKTLILFNILQPPPKFKHFIGTFLMKPELQNEGGKGDVLRQTVTHICYFTVVLKILFNISQHSTLS